MASTNSEDTTNLCRSSSCRCQSQVSRRDVLQILGAGATASALPIGAQVMAGPFAAGDVAGHLIPADKKLTPEWVASLTGRGQAELFTGEQLNYVGMPVGGIGCGQLYLGGDGRLWLWDIFKCNYLRQRDHGKRIAAFTLGGHYAQPVAAGEEYSKRNGAEVAQGFLIRARTAGKNSSTRYPASIDMTAYQGKKARIHIVDEVTGGWAHITVDQIVCSDGTRDDGGIEDNTGTDLPS